MDAFARSSTVAVGAPANGTRLQALSELAIEAGAEHLAGEARVLSGRITQGLFYVACVGQFKRGKSSLINALIGDAVLPIGVVPVTAVVTIVRHGRVRGARLRYATGGLQSISPNDLAMYVTEDKNPGNEKGVTAAEVFVPSPLLATGMCLVDTPGIGSTFLGNTEATRAFVPHIDAALVVLGADPPISGDELAIVTEIAKQCSDILFVLNKADRLSESERSEAGQFTRKVLAERLGRESFPLFEVSAAELLERHGPDRDWPALIEAVTTLAHESRSDLVEAAEERGFSLLADRLRRHVDEERKAMLSPVEESERRVETLRSCVADAKRSLGDLGYLFSAEQDRLGRAFVDLKEKFLERAQPEAKREFVESLRRSNARGGALRREAIASAQKIAELWLKRWLAEAQPVAEKLYVQATQRFVDLANGFLERLADSNDPALSGLPRAVTPETGFRARSRFYYELLVPLTSQMPLGQFLDLVRPRKSQLRVLEREIAEYLETLIFANANRIEIDFGDRVMESRRQFEFEIESSLNAAVASAEQALARAKEYHAQGSQAVQAELDRLSSLDRRLDALGKLENGL